MIDITMLTLGFYIANFRTLPHLKLRATYPDIGLPPTPFYGIMRERLCMTLGAEPHGSYNRADSGFYIT